MSEMDGLLSIRFQEAPDETAIGEGTVIGA